MDLVTAAINRLASRLRRSAGPLGAPTLNLPIYLGFWGAAETSGSLLHSRSQNILKYPRPTLASDSILIAEAQSVTSERIGLPT